jgi:hypothetical protein
MYFIQQQSQIYWCIIPQQRKLKYNMFNKNQGQTLLPAECQNSKIITTKTVLYIEEHNINEEKYKSKTELFKRTMGSMCCKRGEK